MPSTDVLVVGAGPTGLVLALWLTKLGVNVRIVDKTAEPGTTSRALGIQARTLELYSQLDLAEAVVAEAHEVPAVNLWVRGKRQARIAFEAIGAGLTPYPHLYIFPQDRHERLLAERLQALGVGVERQTELIEFAEKGDGVVAGLRRADGRAETCEASYIAGSDGARSTTRQAIDAGFPGGTYRQLFYVADIEGSGPAFDGELHVDLDEADFLAIFPLSADGRARLVGWVRDEGADGAERLAFDDVAKRAVANMQVAPRRVNWFSTYHVHHRVADRFRKGRAFLLGDAAHVHSPAGAQGMNTGIGDAINLAWKLAACVKGRAPDKLLDSYEIERIGFARRLVATTDRVFTFATAEGTIANVLRTRFAPLVIPALAHFEAAREFVFRTVSQIMLNYRGSPLSDGVAGDVHGGDRMPWAPGVEGDNFKPLPAPGWQIHVYGRASEALAAFSAARGLPLTVSPWQKEHEAAGLARDALYLLRPDAYVALAEPSGAPQAIERYLAERSLKVSA